jgi:uncharacterized protein (TIGR02284 family)
MTMIVPGHPIVAPIRDGDAQDTDPTGADRSDWDLVADARTRTLDALAGFDKMAEHAEPEFAPTVAMFRDLHQRHGDALTRVLADAGFPPEDDGSMMGTVNRIVVATRALFDEIDADVLAQVRSGEEHVLAAYDEALAARLPPAVHDELAAMRAELKQVLDGLAPEAV